jgi:DNA invertase Pin-like site-specific DNA recombinase
MKMKRAIIYLRVSTDEQAESGLGLDAQLASAMKKAKEIGAGPILTFSDPGISGSTPIDKRPGLSQALATIGKGDILIVAKRDRLSRSLPIAIAIEELLKTRKANLLSANGEGTRAKQTRMYLHSCSRACSRSLARSKGK